MKNLLLLSLISLLTSCIGDPAQDLKGNPTSRYVYSIQTLSGRTPYSASFMDENGNICHKDTDQSYSYSFNRSSKTLCNLLVINTDWDNGRSIKVSIYKDGVVVASQTCWAGSSVHLYGEW